MNIIERVSEARRKHLEQSTDRPSIVALGRNDISELMTWWKDSRIIKSEEGFEIDSWETVEEFLSEKPRLFGMDVYLKEGLNAPQIL